MKFIFVRHGESQANRDKIIGTPETLLTENGIEQARKTGNELKDKGIKTIICSPFIRAQQTAETIAGELGIGVAHIKIIENLHERRMGSLEGNPRTHESEWYYLESQHDMERCEDVLKRASQALEKINEVVRQQEGTVLVVGHAVSGFYLLQLAASKTSIEDFDPPSQMSNADFIEINL